MERYCSIIFSAQAVSIRSNVSGKEVGLKSMVFLDKIEGDTVLDRGL
jgi:hypothetical protein